MIGIVLDCGATNVRAVAIDCDGKIHAIHSISNNTQVDPNYIGGLIWDIEEIWAKLKHCIASILQKVNKADIVGITVTTFGVDGTFVSKEGQLSYPIISWQCQRTSPVMQDIAKYVDVLDLYNTSGVLPFSFNTINKLVWFKENRPQIIEEAESFGFISALLLQKLCGNLVTETTMLGTSMFSDVKTRGLSKKILDKIGISESIFPEIVEAGAVVGELTTKCADETGLPKGIPVVAAGHDTQFAIFGSGVGVNSPVLSSGTWEILMVRANKTDTSQESFDNQITTEFDARKDTFNVGVQWLGSGILESIKRLYYPVEQNRDEIYEIMIGEAEKANKNHGFKIDIDLYTRNGGLLKKEFEGNRDEIYLATLESLADKTAKSLRILEETSKFKAETLTVVGGGSKNRLWNQLRADKLGIPLKLIDQKETTVLGASMFLFSGVGVFKSPEEAQQKIKNKETIIYPN